MKYLFAVVIICIALSYCSSCKKTTDTISKTDTLTVRDTVRDTVYSKLIRTDKYKGGCQIDYVGGGQEYSPNSTADVSFFTNDSTCVTIHYRVGDTNPFQFSIVSGHYSIPTNMTSGRALFVTPDSLYSDGMEKTGSLSQRSFVFKGKL